MKEGCSLQKKVHNLPFPCFNTLIWRGLMSETLKIKTEKFHKISRVLKALFFAIRYPRLLKPILKPSITSLYAAGAYKSCKLQKISPEKLIRQAGEISLLNCDTRDGNVSYLELLVLASVVKTLNPTNSVEIGTFDGNTTLQLALNTSKKAVVHTIDLPSSGEKTSAPILRREVKFVTDLQKQQRKYQNTPMEHKVVQHLGDSAEYDFSLFCKKGAIDFCFIDGSHSYENVKRDTQKVLEKLSLQGVILWHDYDPNYPGVYRYLNELSIEKKLYHIEKTSFALYGEKLSQISIGFS